MSDTRELDYQLGRDLGQVAQSIKQRSPSKMLSIILDLLKDDRSLQAPLRELVHTPAFLKSTPLKNSASSQALVSTLINEMKAVYRDETVQRLHHILAGYFSLSGPSQTRERAKGNPMPPDTPQGSKPSNRSIKDDAQNKPPWETDQHIIGTNPRLEHLRKLLQNQQWHHADRVTWEILSAALGTNPGGLIPQRAWSAIPCTLLYDINKLWTTNSSHRFGFATQRAIWEATVAIQARLEREEDKDDGITIKPAKQAFFELLGNQEGYTLDDAEEKQMTSDISSFPPGYFPRIGKCMSWGGAKGWITEYRSDHLINEFELLHARLVDCGIAATNLDSDSKQKVASLLISFDPSKSHPKEASRKKNNHQTHAGEEKNQDATTSNSTSSNTPWKRSRSQANPSPSTPPTPPKPASPKPKGFSTMCWIGIILSSIGVAYSLFVVVWQDWIHGKLHLAPSLISLGIINSDTETLYESALFFVYLYQGAFFAEMLQKRLNRVRELITTFAADIIITYLENQLSTDSAATTNLVLLFTIALYAVPTAYFCRQAVHSYLDKS